MASAKRERSRRECALRRLASRQHGLIHRDQALRAGMSDSGIHRRVRGGQWIRHYRCVYGVAGAPETFEQRGLAACLAVGRGAALSHSSAGRMWGFCDGRRRLEVTVRGSVTAEPPGVIVHRSTTLATRDVGRLRGVPVTNPATTLIALAGALLEPEVERLLQSAVLGGTVDPEDLRKRIAAAKGRGKRGPAVLRRLLPECARASHIDSALEKRVEQLLAGPGFPPVSREHPVFVGGRVFYLDFAFARQQVGIEADGRRWHSDADAFERDRQKHNALTAAGWRILRVTDQQVRSDPDGVRARVLELVGATCGNRE